MLETLSKWGAAASKLFGEPNLKNSPSGESENCFSGNPLAKILPWESYDEEHGIFVSENSLGFTLEASPLVGSTETTQKEIASIFQEILEEGESIQCLLWADPRVGNFLDGWQDSRRKSAEIYQKIAHKRASYYQKNRQISSRIFRFIFSYSCEAKDTPANLKKMGEKKSKVLKTLQALTYVYSWDVNDFLENVGALINYSAEKDVKKRHWNPFETLAEQLPCGGSLGVEDDSLQWKTDTTSHFKSYRAVDYPSQWSLPEMQRLIGDVYRDAFRIQVPFFIQYGVHCPKQSKEEGKFKRRSHIIEKQGHSGFLMRLIPALHDEIQECDAVRRELAQTAKFVWTQISAGVWSNTQEELTTAEQSLKSLFRINNFTLAENRYLHLPMLLSALPMTWAEYVDDLHELNLLRTTISPECGTLVPIQGEWMGTRSPGMLLIGRRGQLVNWNPFDNQAGNYNTVVVGRSGSGKSVFMQDLLLSGLGTGSKVYVLEVGRSFEKLCDLLEGQYIEFSKESTICLNPFSNIPKDDEDERDTAVSFLKSIISCMAAPEKGTSDYENALIEKAIREAWTAKQNHATITDVARWLQSQEESVAKTLGMMLMPYTKEGIYAKYFEGKNNVDFTSPMVLIELEELKEKKDLQSVVIQLFIMTITNQAFLGDRQTPFYICIDEAWDLLRGKQTGVFIETLARRLRKYNGSLVIGTQSVDDFFATPGALAAFENSDWMCLLSQKKSSISRFVESGKIEMDDAKKFALESVTTRHGEYSEVMICDADGNYAIERLILDPFSQLLYTTKAEEYAQLKELQKGGMSIAEAIDHVVKRKQEGAHG